MKRTKPFDYNAGKMRKPSLPLHVSNLIRAESVALVAGGAGFVGSHLCERLLPECRVICLDNLRYGKRENIAACLGNEKFTFIEYDITKPITDLLRRRVDYIFHVAGIDEVVRHKKASLDDLLLNTYGTRNLLEKAVSDKAKFLLVSTLEHEKSIDSAIDLAQARLFSESLTVEYGKTFGVAARIIRVGHLFGPRIPLTTQNPMSIIMHDLLKTGEVHLANDEFTRIYPVFIDDCISVILQTMFAKASPGKIFNLIPSQSITLLELAHLIKEIDANFTLYFDREGHQFKPFMKEHFSWGSTLPLPSRQTLIKELKETVRFFRKESAPYEVHIAVKSHGEEQEDSLVKKKWVSFRRPVLLLFVLAVFVNTILPLLLLASTSTIGIATVNSSYKSLQDGKFSEAMDRALTSRQLFTHAGNILRFLSFHFSLFGRQKDHEAIFLLLKAGGDASYTMASLASAAELLSDFFQKSIVGEGRQAKPVLDRAIGELNSVSTTLPIIDTELAQLSTTSLPEPIQTYVRSKQDVFSEYRGMAAFIQTFASLLPDLVGFDDRRIYLLLLQNNMELRPTGGFIGSYGLLVFENGSLSSFDIFDIYSADGQLRGHVDPPSPIRKYLNQPNWYLRDSNWDPDFQSAALQASWFLEKEVDVSPHGVIAVDVSFVKLLLEAIGPLTLSDYKESITSDNLFEKAQQYAEKDFFPGSTQKKDFLGTLSRRIIDRLLHEDYVPWPSVLSAVKRGVSQKHVLFSFHNPAIQQVLTLNNWGGSILSLEEKDGQLFDFRMINEANLGVNKANYYVKRKIRDEVVIGNEGEVTGALSIRYTNDSPNAWPGGPYVNYLRLFFPEKTKLTEISIDGQEATLSAMKKEGALEIEEATQSGKSIFGFLMTVPAKTTKEVSISYELLKTFQSLPGKNLYSYIFQKQPGTGEDPLTVSVHYPQTLRIKDTNAQVFREKQVVVLSTDLSEDRLFEVEFLR